MKNKFIIAAAAAAALSLASCGAVDDQSSLNEKDTPSKASDVSSLAETSDSIAEDTSDSVLQEEESSAVSDESAEEEESSQDDSSEAERAEISGYYIESIGGSDKNYIIVADTGSYIIGIGQTQSVPIAVEENENGLFINRGGVSDTEGTDSVTYGDGTISFEQNGNSYLWRKIDFIPISGTYYQVDEEGTNLAEWVFNGDGTGSVTTKDSETSVAMSYVQTADSLEVSFATVEDSTAYNYTYNVLRLEMTDGGEALTLVAANS